MTLKKQATIQSLQNGLFILEMIANEKRPLKFTEIQQLTKMTKSNVHKYLATLTLQGFLHKNQEHQTYQLGTKIMELASSENRASIVDVAAPYVKAFTQLNGITALIALPTEDGPLIKNIWSVTYGINIGAQNGTTLPLYSSTGVIFFAFEKGNLMQNWLQQSLASLDKNTRRKIIEEKPKIRAEKFVLKSEPLVAHISSCSVPIFNSKHQLVAAITAVGIHGAMPKTVDDPIAQQMIQLAHDISRNLK